MPKQISRSRKTEHASDGTNTMDGSTDCLPASTDFTSDLFDVGIYSEIGIYLKCSNVTTAIATKYQVSPDNETWMDGAATITSMDNNQQWINVTEKGVQYIRINANNTNTSAATVTIMFSVKA